MAGPTGGTITTNGNKTVHTFTSGGTFTPNKAGNVEVLVVGGGGGGGGYYYGGGGGGGHVEYSSSLAVTAQEYTVTVGGGGNGGGGNLNGDQGGSSSFDTITAVGGTGGHYGNGPTSGVTGDGLGGAVNTGGDGGTSYDPTRGGGGGGGDSAAGSNGGQPGNGGAGGAGTANSISGSSVTYGGGGGGGGYYGSNGGVGGTGGGGKGAGNDGAAVAGTANTGGGGGGGYHTSPNAYYGADGGSGVVIISYVTADFEEGTNAEISDSATASDSFDSLIDELSESSTVGDTITAGFLLSSEISDAATASDVFEAFLNATDIEGNITASDSFEIGLAYTAEISDSATASDAFELFPVYPETVEESLDFGDADENLMTMRPSISDGLDLSGISFPGWFATISDSIFIYDAIRNGWIVTAESTLDFADSIETILGIIVDEWLTLIDSETNNWNGQEIVPDTLNLYDVSQMWKVISDTLSESLDLAEAATWSLTITVLEYLGFADLAQAVRTSAASVNESVAFADLSQHTLSFLIEETLSAVDVSSVIAAFAHSIAESIDLADSTSPIKKIYETTTEPLVFTEVVSSRGAFHNLVYDTIAMNITVELGGEVYECYVLNTPKFMPSMYSGFDFNSYCVFENRAFGANDTGVYELTGDTDAGSTIHTGAILNETDFESPNQKRFRRGYLGISGASPVMVFETEDGARQVYNIDTQGKLVASHELKSKKWKLSIADFESIDTIDLIPIILTK